MLPLQFGLVHIAAGDLLRAEIAADTVNGKLAKEYMEKGMLVPDEIVVVNQFALAPCRSFLAKDPRSLPPDFCHFAASCRKLATCSFFCRKIAASCRQLSACLSVNENILVERVVGRRLDPVTGKIYHMKYSPPENEEIARRLVQRFDDTEEK
ncbi:hypothetical protein KSP40_PGU017316 [Platanthera guangdongensis]|uniref:adenylate kinase n=1 Tax=Platanthera guangdongensis TaxID=2320717 RepID=A0ABR2MNF4_9ASPA